jgi:thiol-disulfide isomerase/thioredoxin
VRIRSTLTAFLAAAAFAVGGCSGDTEPSDTGDDQNASQDASKEAEEGASDRAPDSAPDEARQESQESEGKAQQETGDRAAVPATLAFRSKTVDGKPFDGATLAGKPTMLWFWAPWCPKCRTAAPSVANAAKGFGADVNIVGVAGLAESAEIQQFVKDYDLSGITNLANENYPLWSKFEIGYQDTYVILDADGKQLHNGTLTDSQLTGKLSELAG